MRTKSKPSKSKSPVKGKPAKPGQRPSAGKPSRKAKRAVSPAADKPAMRPNTKLATLIGMLGRTEGATLDQLVKATGWQPHSVRGAMSGALKKKLGLTITSSKTGDVRVYRIEG